MTILQQTSTQPTKNTEYVVNLETVETDELGIGFERKVAVQFDDEVNWDNWLDYFNKEECVEYKIIKIVEVGDSDEFKNLHSSYQISG